MVGIRDVARKANVSPATVSRVLNNDQTIHVAQATRQRIVEAAAALDYDISTRKYIKKRMPSIGVISTIGKASEEQDIYYKHLRVGMEEEARRLHLGMNRIYNLSDNPKQWEDLDQLGAVIVVGTVTKESITALLKQNMQIVVVDNPDIQQEVDMVYADLERMTKTVLELFLENGHKRIAYIGGYKVDMDELLKTPVTNFDQALTGKIAGVVVTTSDGALGAEANITIRGNNSLTQSSAPLYVIDGFPTESSMATALNSADIESIDILKDASATAIYGARGANGVIVITTKQGQEGKPKVNFSATWTMNQIANKVKLMDGYDFVKLQTEIYDITGNTNAYLKPSDEDALAGITSYSVEDYRGVASSDWQDKLFRTALTQNYTVSVSGGSKDAGNRYNISLSALDQDGIIIRSNFQRYQGKINFQQKFGKKVTLDVLANYSRAITNGVTPTNAQAASSATGWLMYSVWGYRPVKPLRSGKSDDLYDDLVDSEVTGANDYRFNPVKTAQNEYRKTIVDYLNANTGLTWEIIEGLKLKITAGYTMNKRRREEFNGTQTYNGYPGSPSGKGINGAIYWNSKVTWLNENTLTWTKHIRRQHHLQLLGGFTMQGETFDYKGTSATQLTTESLGLNGLHTGNYQSVKPWQHDWTMMSGLFRLNYNYKYKYYLTASFRADGSSKFPAGNRWGYFPSAGLSWNFNREDWFKNATWLSNGKLRLSWGQTGNNRTSTPYDYYSQISTLPGDPSSYDYVQYDQRQAQMGNHKSVERRCGPLILRKQVETHG